MDRPPGGRAGEAWARETGFQARGRPPFPDMATHEPAAGAGGRLRLCDFIRERRTLILEEWERAARLIPEARRLSHPRLLDHLPPLLERMADRVESVHSGAPGSLAEWPEIHALQRLDMGFGLEQVVHEYSLLRTSILRLYGQHLGREGGRDAETLLREIRCLDETFDEAVATAVSRYSRARERTLVALDRI
ncbi:MAG TPA: hypothetical protein VEU33_37300, partial [Archangium sp.]|nr:hypothetical protein [Archangium sp.]